jgi:hypothetical protein
MVASKASPLMNAQVASQSHGSAVRRTVPSCVSPDSVTRISGQIQHHSGGRGGAQALG